MCLSGTGLSTMPPLFCICQVAFQKRFMQDLNANIALAADSHGGATTGPRPPPARLESGVHARLLLYNADCSPGYCGASDEAASAGDAAAFPPAASTLV